MQPAQLDTAHGLLQFLPAQPTAGPSRFPGVPMPEPQAATTESSGTAQSQADVSNAPLAPLFSYISHGMDTLLQSIQRSQAAAHGVVMAEVATICQELKAGHAQAADHSGNPSAPSDNTGSYSCLFPPKKKTSRQRRHFIPSNPDDPENKKDIQQHINFSV